MSFCGESGRLVCQEQANPTGTGRRFALTRRDIGAALGEIAWYPSVAGYVFCPQVDSPSALTPDELWDVGTWCRRFTEEEGADGSVTGAG